MLKSTEKDNRSLDKHETDKHKMDTQTVLEHVKDTVYCV